MSVCPVCFKFRREPCQRETRLVSELRTLATETLAGQYAIGDEPAFELAEKVIELLDRITG